MKRNRRPHGLPRTIANDTIPFKGKMKTLCYLYKWALYSNGYGHMQIGRKSVLAHRYYYELLVGPIPAGMTIDHLCGNPACVAPLHLEPVSIQINSQRGRHTKLDQNKVVSIRAMCKEGRSNKDIAAIFNICSETVRDVVAGRRWGNIA